MVFRLEGGTGMKVGNALALAAVFLIVGLAVGAVIFSRPEIITRTVTETTTLYSSTALTKTVTATETIATTELLTTTITQPAGVTTVTTTKTVTLDQVKGVCFSATEDCESVLIGLIKNARKSVHVMIYSFTLDELSEALIEAKNRGVDVKVVIERENAYGRGSEYQKLLEAGVEVKLDGNPSLMHHKVMIIDGEVVVTGSYNWSWSAENRNDENLVVIEDSELASLYEEEFQRVWGQAR